MNSDLALKSSAVPVTRLPILGLWNTILMPFRLNNILLTFILTIIFSLNIFSKPLFNFFNLQDSGPQSLIFPIWSLASGLLLMLAIAVAIKHYYYDSDGSIQGIKQNFQSLSLYVFAYTITMFISIFFIMIGLYFFVIPAIVISVYFCVALPVSVIESKSGFFSLVQSIKLVHKHWWDVFLLLLRLFVMVFAIFILSTLVMIVMYPGAVEELFLILFSTFFFYLPETVYLDKIAKNNSIIILYSLLLFALPFITNIYKKLLLLKSEIDVVSKTYPKIIYQLFDGVAWCIFILFLIAFLLTI